jgi:branched-chain amino acid transport system ATP-binding protein
MADLLHIRGLVKRFGGLAATDGVDLAVAADEIHALIGPNGAGKTTLIHQIAGSLRPDSGHIVFDGQDVTRLGMHTRVGVGLARSFQLVSLFRKLSVLDNLAFSVQARSGTSFRFWRAAADERALFEEARTLAKEVDLADRIDARAGTLAHGEQRRLEIGLALATRPRLLLLDEPLAGLGPEESDRMVTLISALRARCTMLLVEHDMDAVFRLADRVSVLVSGRIIATGTPDEIRAHPEVRRAYLGDDAMVDG